MGRKRVIILIGLVVVAVILVIAALLLSRDREDEVFEVGTPTPTPIPMVSIAIARNNLNRGMVISEGLVELRPWPEDRLPDLYVTDLEDIYGLTVLGFIGQGVPINLNQLGEGPEVRAPGSDLAIQIPTGKRAIAIPLDMLSAIGWYLQPGDRVDIIASWRVIDLDEDFQSLLPNRWVILQCPEGATCEGVMGRMELLPSGQAVMVYPSGLSQTGYFAQMTIQDAEVLRIGPYVPQETVPQIELVEEQVVTEEEVTPPPPQIPSQDVVVLLLDIQDTLVLKALLELQADVDLVMRGIYDQDVATTTAVTLDYIVTRYAIEQPPKLPFGVTAPTVNPLVESYILRAIQEAAQSSQQAE
ncbi:MAG: Flp pilus assembly protein CpaB [Anaerolineae bacterium]|nr:Flp pilus assembly protein CpaB [Anaerolineae bacterium]